MKRTAYTLFATAALGLVLPTAASAEKFTWFDESPARDSLGQLRPPSSLFDRNKRLTFGVDAYKSLASEDYSERPDYFADSNVISVYGEVLRTSNDFYAPLAVLNRGPGEGASPLMDSASSRLSGFGIRWQHRVDASNTLALAAGYSESPWVTQQGMDILDTRAALSWTSTWSGAMRPGMTGSVFIGDESVRDDLYQRVGGRYMGFAFGGQLQVSPDHTPYFSYRMQRRFYNPTGTDEAVYSLYPYEDRSQIAAGWRWQVQSNWSVHAEASYGLNGVTLDPYTTERSRVFFGTRFDFR